MKSSLLSFGNLQILLIYVCLSSIFLFTNAQSTILPTTILSTPTIITTTTLPSIATFQAFQNSNCTIAFNDTSPYPLPNVILEKSATNVSCTVNSQIDVLTTSSISSLSVNESSSYSYNCSQQSNYTAFDYYYYYNQTNCEGVSYDDIEINSAELEFECIPATLTIVRPGGKEVKIGFYAQLYCHYHSSSSHPVALAIALGIGAICLIVIVSVFLVVRKRRKVRQASGDAYTQL